MPEFTLLVFPNDLGRFDVTYSVNLNGENFQLRLRYNQRAERYFGELYDNQGQLVRGSCKVVTGWPMWLGLGYDQRTPIAALLPQTLSPDESPPTLDDLGEGQRVELHILEPIA